MERAESYEMLAPLLAAQLKRGVCTNAFAAKEDYLREIRAGTLWTHESPGCLLLLRRRESHWRVSFYLQKGASPPALELDVPAVTELASRPRDAAMAAAVECWQAKGYRLLFHRERLALPAGQEVERGPFPARIAAPEDREAVAAILAEQFDPLTGCLPGPEELEEALAAGDVVCVDDGGGRPAGLLHIAPGRGSTELRHLAVRSDLRRKGAARSLLAAYLDHTEHRKSLVWVRKDNAPAEAFYRGSGYAPDGWTSAVLCRP